MASMRVRRAATSANSAATKNAFASTSATTATRRRPGDSEPGGGRAIEAGTKGGGFLGARGEGLGLPKRGNTHPRPSPPLDALAGGGSAATPSPPPPHP